MLNVVERKGGRGLVRSGREEKKRKEGRTDEGKEEVDGNEGDKER